MSTYPTILPHTIVLIGDPRTEEARAAGTITPGDLLIQGSAGTLLRHSAAGAVNGRLFAKEDALQGNGIDDNYSSGDLVNYCVGVPGNVIYAWLSGGETAVIGSKLTSNGDGKLKVAGGSDIVIATAEEAVDASDSNDVDERIKVRLV